MRWIGIMASLERLPERFCRTLARNHNALSAAARFHPPAESSHMRGDGCRPQVLFAMLNYARADGVHQLSVQVEPRRFRGELATQRVEVGRKIRARQPLVAIVGRRLGVILVEPHRISEWIYGIIPDHLHSLQGVLRVGGARAIVFQEPEGRMAAGPLQASSGALRSNHV